MLDKTGQAGVKINSDTEPPGLVRAMAGEIYDWESGGELAESLAIKLYWLVIDAKTKNESIVKGGKE